MQQRSRSPAFLDAVPDRQPGEGKGGEAGSLVPFSGVRCPTKGCHKKLGDFLEGTYETTCPRCKQKVRITR